MQTLPKLLFIVLIAQALNARNITDDTGSVELDPPLKERYVRFHVMSDLFLNAIWESAGTDFPDNTVISISNGAFSLPYKYIGPPNTTIAGVPVTIPNEINEYFVLIDTRSNWSTTFDVVELLNNNNTFLLINRTSLNANTNFGSISPYDPDNLFYANANTGGINTQASIYASCDVGQTVDAGDLAYNTYWPTISNGRVRMILMFGDSPGGSYDPDTATDCLPIHLPDVFVKPIIPIEVMWESKDMTNNPIEEEEEYKATGDFPYWQIGRRYFPGKVLPDETEPRNIVNVKVKSIPGQTIKLKAFDVADVTPAELGAEVDPNGEASGNDNLIDYLNTPITGEFVVDGDSTIGATANGGTATVLIPDDGVAIIGFKVGMQPGNNYRIAAEHDSNHFTSQIDTLQVTTPGSFYDGTYIRANDIDYVSSIGFEYGSLSPMLTVWRKLHIEQDSMDTVPIPKSFPDRGVVSSDSWQIDTPQTGFSTFLAGEGSVEQVPYDFYKNGHIEADSTTSIYKVFGNTDQQVTTVGAPSSSDQLIDAWLIYDDDDQGLAPDKFPILPNINLLSQSVIDRYTPSFIKVVDTDELSINPNRIVPFKINEAAQPLFGLSSTNDGHDLSDSVGDQFFWNHHIIACYQSDESDDHDPNTEPTKMAYQVQSLLGIHDPYIVVFLECIREDDFSLFNSSNPANLAAANENYVENVNRVVAHEIGHAPGDQNELGDHDEGGLMEESYSFPDFSAKTIKRFREAEEWR